MRFSEAEIRAVMVKHYPYGDVEYYENGAEAFCGCTHVRTEPPYGKEYIKFDEDHLIDVLKEARLAKGWTRHPRRGVEDRWRRADGTPSTRCFVGLRWRARWVDQQGVEHCKSFARKRDAQKWLDENV